MSHSREINNEINRLHERALRMVYGDDKSCFQQLLDEDKSVTIHQRTKINSKNKISQKIMNKIFKFKEPMSSRKSRTVSFSTSLKKKYLHGQQKIILVAFAKHTFKTLALFRLLCTVI